MSGGDSWPLIINNNNNNDNSLHRRYLLESSIIFDFDKHNFETINLMKNG